MFSMNDLAIYQLCFILHRFGLFYLPCLQDHAVAIILQDLWLAFNMHFREMNEVCAQYLLYFKCCYYV